MINPTIIGAGIAFALIALAIVALIWVIRVMRRPTRRVPAPNPAVEPPTAPATAGQAAPPPMLLSTLAPSLPYARIAHLLSPAEGDFFAAPQAAAPAGMFIFAQVRLANLVEVQPWARRDKSHW